MNCKNVKCENWDCNQYGYGCTIIIGACPFRQELKARSKKNYIESEVIVSHGDKKSKRDQNQKLCNGGLS